jgi:hypothetical protein
VWWVDPAHSAALEDRGLVLESVAFADLRPRPLATTVVYLPWLAWSPDGTTLALVGGTGGSPTHDKRLELCRVAPPSCSVIAIPAGAVALDPAWSADGTRLAFVTALDWTAPASGQAWFATRRVWAASSDGSGAEPVTGAPPGVTAPTWLSPDVIGYVTGAGIQAVNVDSGSVVTFADRLSGASGAGPDSYGKTPWGGLAVWRP